MANQRIQWQLRYRSPLSPTRGVDDVIIETETDEQADAEALAKWYLDTKVASPATRFVYVRRLVVATSADKLLAQTAPAAAAKKADDEKMTGPSPAQAASRDDMPETARQQTAGGAKAGRVGA